LGATDETVRDQIIFYHSYKQSSQGRGSAKQHADKNETDASRGEEQHKQDEEERAALDEELRRVGLAQGMVDFVRYVERPATSYESGIVCRVHVPAI
jgi:hypothetical protein